MTEIPNFIHHVAFGLGEDLRGDVGAGSTEKRFGQAQAQRGNLGFTVEIENQVVGQGCGQATAGFQQLADRGICIRFLADLAVIVTGKAIISAG